MQNYKFEAAMVIGIENLETPNEIHVSMMLQFSNMSNQNEEFMSNLENVFQTDNHLKELIKLEPNATTKFENCPKLSTLKAKIPPEIWEASNLFENYAIQVLRNYMSLRLRVQIFFWSEISLLQSLKLQKADNRREF